MKDRLLGVTYLFITALIWGGSFISQLFGGLLIGSYSFIGYRGIFGCLTILVMILFDNYKRLSKFCFFRNDEDIKKTILNSMWCGFVLFLSMITQQIGVEITDIAKSGLIASLEVIVVPILMMILYHKRIKLVTWVFIITSMIGIMLLNLKSTTGFNIGDFYVFLSTIFYSITIIQVPKYIKDVDPLKFSFFRWAFVGILSFILAIIFKNRFITLSNIKEAIPSILYSGVLASGIAYTFQILGQKYCEPVIATLIMSLEGVFAAILGWIVLGQVLNLIQIIGIIVAFISICIVQITDSEVV